MTKSRNDSKGDISDSSETLVSIKNSRQTDTPTADTPPLFENYGTWLEKSFKFDLIQQKNIYESASLRIEEAARTSTYWTSFLSERTNINDLYVQEFQYPLFVSQDASLIERKHWDSFLKKTYRRNILENANWPKPPNGGWLIPENWLADTNDIVRTRLVVKYLDGVKFLTDKLELLPGVSDFLCDFQAREFGYYAAHTYVSLAVEVPVSDWSLKSIQVQFEIQVTTQLQEVILRLTHKEYEARRMKPAADNSNWQWDYASPAFQPNYLGHILHYTEGMIMEVRERGKN